MIGVGINENVFISSISMAGKDNDYLEIGFDNTDSQRPTSAFDMLDQTGIVDVPPVFNMFLFKTKTPANEDGKLTREKMIERVTRDIKANKEIMTHLLMGYLPTADADLKAYQYLGIDIDANNFESKILSQRVLDAIFKNLVSAFIDKLKPFVGDKKHAFRLLLVRQAADKHYASFRKNYIAENPFWEPMEVAKAASKVKFTDYEVAQNLTDATPIQRSAADAKKTGGNTSATGGGATSGQPPLTAASVFGGGA